MNIRHYADKLTPAWEAFAFFAVAVWALSMYIELARV